MSTTEQTQEFSHIDASGKASMVDISAKDVTARLARAEVIVKVSALTQQKIQQNEMAKGDVLATARIAGIQGAKKCADLIPLCHTLMLNKVGIEFEWIENHQLRIESLCKVTSKTGVEMEALTAASIAALTVYDMCKAIDKGICIDGLKLLEKDGGRSGHYQNPSVSSQVSGQ